MMLVLADSNACSLKSIYLVRRNSQARRIRCSHGNQAKTLLSSCGHTYTNLGIGSERKLRTEKLVKVMVLLLFCNGRSKMVDKQKVQEFRFLNGTIHHVVVHRAVWSNLLVFLTH